MAVSGWLCVRPRNSFKKGRGKQLHHNKNPKTPAGFASSTLLQCVSLFHFLRQALMCVRKMHEGKLWFLVFPSTDSSLFTAGIGICISWSTKMVEIEHCRFMAMPVDVPCVNRRDHSMASSTKSWLSQEMRDCVLLCLNAVPLKPKEMCSWIWFSVSEVQGTAADEWVNAWSILGRILTFQENM